MIGFLQNLVDALSLGSVYALTALGIGLMFGILRLINIAHGDFITFAAYTLVVPSTAEVARVLIGGWHPALLVPAVCMLVIALALACDFLAFRPLRKASAPTLMAASFAASYVIQNGIQAVHSARPKSVDLWSGLNVQAPLGPVGVSYLNLVTVGVTLALLALLTQFLRGTAYGVQMRAAAEDFRMARYLGVRANLVIGLAFAISGILAAAAALLFVSQTGTLTQTLGQPIALYGFIAVVVGGMGSLIGAVIGGFLLGLIVTMLQAYLPPDVRVFRDALAFGLVVLVLIVRPTGLVKARGIVQRV